MENSIDTKLTPAMKQFLEIKKKHRDDILFFRMGDFYEMFFEDAHTASKILDIALTSRQNDIPMCGIPYHASESYIARLIKAGKRVAICEQLETVPSSGTIVRREVVRVITPGTVIEQGLLQSDDNNFLASIVIGAARIGLAFVDISTGDFYLTTIEKSPELFRGELAKYNPTEAVFLPGEGDDDELYAGYVKARNIPLYKISEWLYDTDYLSGVICSVYGIASLKGLGITESLEIMTAGSVIQYLQETQKQAFTHMKHPQLLRSSNRMVLDDATIGNLELVRNQNDGSKIRTLYAVLNHTRTPMGRRTLERNILQPLIDEAMIESRLDVVQYFFEYHELAERTLGLLDGMFDVERLLSRFTLGKTFPRNFLALRDSLRAASRIREALSAQPHDPVRLLGESIPDLGELASILEGTIEDEPALTPEQGRVVRRGYSGELDHLYDLKTNARDWAMQYQEQEKKRLNISTLKVKYNKILGYYIEVSKAQAVNMPENYFRKQTLLGAERYTTEELQGFESDILSASEKIVKLEESIIESLRGIVLENRKELQSLAMTVGDIDFYCSLARAALENRLVRPLFNAAGRTAIVEGRHPVVEKYYTREVFIPNDLHLDAEENLIQVITGPNMSGKSTYIRQFAVIQLMAQIGSFVPAASADLTVADRIFTRIGASDNISRGESTFLVEMNETANILNNATSRSIIIMDEVGRGTSTYDGLSIAWAIVEYILRYLRARTLFATHYHELTSLGNRKGIVNCNVMVREHLHGVDFLHKVVPGAADKSYGIHVAKLAGIPKQIITRAATILEKMEKSALASRNRSADLDAAPADTDEQLEIFNASNHMVIQAIRSIDLDAVTPIEALNELNRLKKLIE